MKRQHHMTPPSRTTSAGARAPLLSQGWCVCLLALVSCLLWGSAIPCIKLGYEYLAINTSDVPSLMLFAGMRFMLAGAIALAATGIGRRRLPRVPRSSWHKVAKLALAQTIVQYVFFYIGVANAPGVRGSIINGSSTFFAILVAALVFHQERLDARKVFGCAVGFTGVVLANLTGGDLGGTMTFTGEGFILIASVSSAVSAALIHIFAQDDDPVALSGWQFVVGGTVLTCIGLVLGGQFGQIDPRGIGMLAYLACVSGVAYSLWSLLLKHNPTSRVVIYEFSLPIFGVVLSSLLLGEANSLPWYQTALALLLVAAGIVVVNLPNQKDRLSPLTAPRHRL